MADEVYTIDIPGAADVFRVPIPGQDDEALRRQRIARMRSKRGALPESLDWIPPLITTLDDAQDMLIVGLTLAKPLLKRLPARFVPYLGWLLLANDVINLTTMLAGMITGGTGVKRSHLDALDIMNSNRLRRINKVSMFLSRTNWLGFALQAGQVSETLSGYGLTLGSIMGCVSDSAWGLIRLAQGAEVQVRMPPTEDISFKAATLIMRTPAFRMFPDLISDEDHAIILSAHKIAADVLMQGNDPSNIEARADELKDMKVPIFTPTNPATIRALEAEGLGQMTRFSNVWGDNTRTSNFLQFTQAITTANPAYQNYMRTMYASPGDAPKIMQMMHDEAGLDFWDYQAKQPKSTSYILEPWEVSAARALEYGVFPQSGTPPRYIYSWLVVSWKQMYTQRFQSHWGWWLVSTSKIILPQLPVYAPDIPENLPPFTPRPRSRKKHISYAYHKCLFMHTWGPLSFFPDDPAIEICRKEVSQW